MRTIWGWASVISVFSVAAIGGASSNVLWEERMTAPLTWRSPSKHTQSEINAVFSVETRDGVRALHARHDGKNGPSPPHYGHGFAQPPRLVDACHLSFKWRVVQHPLVSVDPWSDLGASVYVITRVPGVLSNGRGFKLGWTAKPAPQGTLQRGILQVAIRSGAGGWKHEHLDLCAMYRAQWGEPGEERIQYIGVVTDADSSKSIAEADYTDFLLER